MPGVCGRRKFLYKARLYDICIALGDCHLTFRAINAVKFPSLLVVLTLSCQWVFLGAFDLPADKADKWNKWNFHYDP